MANKVMPLSQAIRLGAMLHPQGFGECFDGVGTCAFGAAREAIGIDPGWPMVTDKWPWMSRYVVGKCPQCGVDAALPSIVSMHLNDGHRWTRERIADWVESEERKLEATEQSSELEAACTSQA